MIPVLFVADDLWTIQNRWLTLTGILSRDEWEKAENQNPLGWDECSLSVESEWEVN